MPMQNGSNHGENKVNGNGRNGQFSKEFLANIWKPGQTGNPSGRPKGTVSIRAKIRQALEKNPKLAEEIVDAAFKQALKGNSPYFKEIVETVDGKITQPLEHSGHLTFDEVMSLGAYYRREQQRAGSGRGEHSDGVSE